MTEPAESEDLIYDLDVWTIPGVHGNVTFMVYGDRVILHTADDQPTVYTDELFARTSEGRPIEMTSDQAVELAQFIIAKLVGAQLVSRDDLIHAIMALPKA